MTKEAFGDLIVKISVGLFFVLVFTILLFTTHGCGGEAPFVESDLGRGVDLDEPAVSGDEYQGRVGGSLPPGFNQRGCQWDNPACGPTPGAQTMNLTNPIRENGR